MFGPPEIPSYRVTAWPRYRTTYRAQVLVQSTAVQSSLYCSGPPEAANVLSEVHPAPKGATSWAWPSVVAGSSMRLWPDAPGVQRPATRDPRSETRDDQTPGITSLPPPPSLTPMRCPRGDGLRCSRSMFRAIPNPGVSVLGAPCRATASPGGAAGGGQMLTRAAAEHQSCRIEDRRGTAPDRDRSNLERASVLLVSGRGE